MQNKKILVTGGAGYIGSHVVRQLGSQGENVVTLDNLSTGFSDAVTAGELVVGDTGDAAVIEKVNRHWAFAFDEWGYHRLTQAPSQHGRSRSHE